MKILGRLKAAWIATEFFITVPFVILLMKIWNRHHWYFRKKWSRLQSYFSGYTLEIVGEPCPDAKLLLLNHQSLFDIIVMDASYPKNISWVAKQQIADIPFFGQILTVPKMISIDRENKRSLIKLFSEAKQRLDEGRVIAMFPEGTRGDSKKLLPFKSGAKLLATKLHLKVQPAVIINTRRIFDSQNFTSQSGKVKIIYLEPIDPDSDKEWFSKLHQKMQVIIDKETKKT